jgi:uncharacterized protein with NRDE domain
MIGSRQFHIGCDRYNFILGQRIVVFDKKMKKEVERFGSDSSYYSTLEALMVDLQKRKLKNIKAATLDELQNNIKRSKEEVMGFYKQLGEEELS